MKMIRAIIRPEKSSDILFSLNEKGFHAATRASVLGRGKEQGLKVGNIHYDEIPKDIISIVVEDSEEAAVTSTIIAAAKTGKTGAYGDGKIFILPVERVFTISTGEEKL